MGKLRLREVTIYFTPGSTSSMESLVLPLRIYAFISSYEAKIPDSKDPSETFRNYKEFLLLAFEPIEESLPLYFYLYINCSLY